ncbi:MAG: class I SAM-dependent RNA methyltransferase [Eubacteriales bacterium]
MTYRFFAACSFGLEAVVKHECEALGFSDIAAYDARVYFSGSSADLAKANLWLRSADRIYMVLDEFEATDFEALYQGVKKINWPDYIGKDDAFPVTGDSVRSALFSVSDVQKIAKKAIVDSLKARYRQDIFAETENTLPVHIAILKDRVSVLFNTSGAGLNRRGYRRMNGEAPLRETLAAGLLSIARYRGGSFYDPMCGSGTIAIEAAMIAKNIAPGLQRKFAFEAFPFLENLDFSIIREEAKAGIIKDVVPIFASDVDERVLELAKTHAKTAGVFDHIKIYKADIRKALNGEPEGILVTNPPYAVRMGEKKETERLYRKMGDCILNNPYLKAFIISADMGFEKFFGKQADKKRKLYNGNIKCNYYQYFRGIKRKNDA